MRLRAPTLVLTAGLAAALFGTACGRHAGSQGGPPDGDAGPVEVGQDRVEVGQDGAQGTPDAEADVGPIDLAAVGADTAADAPSANGVDAQGGEAVGADADGGPVDRGANVDVAAVCGPVGSGTFFVDPVVGVDDDAHTGARGCPVRSVTRAIAAITSQRAAPGATGAAATIAIVNGAAGGVTLNVRTGEVFPLNLPAAVTLTSVDPAAPPPTILLPDNPMTSPPLPPSLKEAIAVSGPGWRVTRLILDCNGGASVGVRTGFDGALDHAIVERCPDGVWQTGGAVTLGPGLVLRQNTEGVRVLFGKATIVGGRGAEHTSISQNTASGVLLDGSEAFPPGARLEILAPAIAPDAPDANDVDIDGNANGIEFGGDSQTAVMHGVHMAGNGTALLVLSRGTTLELRGSFLAGNRVSAVTVLDSHTIGTIDLGGAASADWGRNVFSTANQPASVNTGAAICAIGEAGTKLKAAGNLFRGMDCAQGGALRGGTCSSQVDVASGATVDVGACTLTN